MGVAFADSQQADAAARFRPFVPGVFHAPYANCYRCPIGLNPDNCAAECLRFIEEQLFVHLVHPEEVAAIVVEPIQGEGGYVVPPNMFHERLREITASTACSSSSTRSSRAWGARARCSRSSTWASHPMS